MKNVFASSLLLSGILLFIACSQQKEKDETVEETSTKNENFKWITLDEPYVFVSNKKDTLSIKVVEEYENTEISGNSDYFSYTSYEYVSSWDSKRNKFLELHTSSDGWADLNLHFLNGRFDLLSSPSFNSNDTSYLQKAKNFSFNKEALNDVWFVKSKELNPGKSATVVWWSRSKGLVQFITNDKKTWKRVE